MRLIKRLIVSAGCLSLLACKSLPVPPQGPLYMHSVIAGMALCSDLQSGTSCPAIAMSATDKFIMFSPVTWEALSNYIDALIRLAKGSSSGTFSRSVNSQDQELLDVLYKIKFAMRNSDLIFKKQRK